MRTAAASLFLAASIFAVPVFAVAQSGPTAADIIAALKPTGTVSGTTRGIRPLNDGIGPAAPSNALPGPAAPAAMSVGPAASSSHAASHAAPAAANMAPAPVNPRSIDLNITFDSGSATLNPSAVSTLDALGKALTDPALAADTFKIVGHTDTVGAPASNETLSVARADAVKSYLEAKFGITDARLEASGVGSSDPVVPTPPQTPNLRNRRVQIVNISG